jgi:hypothetical protein
MSNVLPFEKQVYVIRALGKGVPLRHIAHILDVHEDTVARYVRLVALSASVAVQPQIDQVLDPDQEPFWLYHNFAQHAVPVHKPTCPHARVGASHGGQTGRSGIWIEVVSFDDAKRKAKEIAPRRDSICNVCLGKRFSLGRRRYGTHDPFSN